jgi:hypothetical protein
MVRRSCLAGAVVLILLATPAWAVKKPHRLKLTKLGAGVYHASEFDAAATYHLLQNCRNGCYEANPMVRPFARNPSVFVVAGARAYTVNYFARRLKNRGHHRWATALRILAIGVHAGAGAQALALGH